MTVPHRPILGYYDDKLHRCGDTAEGAGWPNEADRQTRFAVMTEPVRNAPALPAPVVCDLGCGTGEMLRYLCDNGYGDVGYIGVDASALALSHARAKFPQADWRELDVLQADDADVAALACDYLVANGLFTVRHSLSNEAMWEFMTGVLRRLWPHVRRGIVFNVMSTVVDWERDDLFHVSHDRMAHFLHGLAGRRVQMRADYGLYEYTCLAFKPEPAAAPRPASLIAYRPRLPDAQHLSRYLQRADSTRLYSNHGPLAVELERRLGDALGLGPQHLLCAASGTAALVAGLLAGAGRATAERPYALCPAYTFVATASALQQCGYIPWLVDIDADTWQLDAEQLLQHPMLDRVGVVVPVAANGRAVPLAPWDRFRQHSGVPVVVDGAACLEALLDDPERFIGAIPVALSFHATKVFATGEGGALVTRDRDLALAAYRAMNFGFLMTRESRSPSLNGKMSEHHAAVGLASLDLWPRHHAALLAVTALYREAFAAAGMGAALRSHPQTSSNYVLLQLPEAADTDRLMQSLAQHGIETRLWYGRGLQTQPTFASLPRDSLAVTERLAGRLLGLPVAPDLTRAEVERVLGAVLQALAVNCEQPQPS